MPRGFFFFETARQCPRNAAAFRLLRLAGGITKRAADEIIHDEIIPEAIASPLDVAPEPGTGRAKEASRRQETSVGTEASILPSPSIIHTLTHSRRGLVRPGARRTDIMKREIIHVEPLSTYLER